MTIKILTPDKAPPPLRMKAKGIKDKNILPKNTSTSTDRKYTTSTIMPPTYKIIHRLLSITRAM